LSSFWCICISDKCLKSNVAEHRKWKLVPSLGQDLGCLFFIQGFSNSYAFGGCIHMRRKEGRKFKEKYLSFFFLRWFWSCKLGYYWCMWCFTGWKALLLSFSISTSKQCFLHFNSVNHEKGFLLNCSSFFSSRHLLLGAKTNVWTRWTPALGSLVLQGK